MILYEQLEVARTASPQEIKRAYFRLVRRYTPEKEPDAFMRIRQAYETLSDEARRNAYDADLSRLADVPGEVAAIIMEAERLSAKRLWADAVRVLEKSPYAKDGSVQCSLANLYLSMDKSGMAAKVMDRLIAKEPNNENYLRLAVKVYLERGWMKKAAEIRKYLDFLDPDNDGNASALLRDKTGQAPFRTGEIVEMVEKKGGKAPLLCARLLHADLRLAYERLDAPYQQLSFELFGEGSQNTWGDPAFAAKKLAEHTEGIKGEKRDCVRDIIEYDILDELFDADCYHILPDIDQAIRNVGAEYLFQTSFYEVLSLGYTAWKAVQEGIPKELAALPLMIAWSQADILTDRLQAECRDEILFLEMDILDMPFIFVPHLRRFKEAFSPFYQHAADFFQMIQQAGDQKLLYEFNRRIPKAKKLGSRLVLDFLGKGDSPGNPGGSVESEKPAQPVRVVKIGRNDPCPCGSGKKYKKCCAV